MKLCVYGEAFPEGVGPACLKIEAAIGGRWGTDVAVCVCIIRVEVDYTPAVSKFETFSDSHLLELRVAFQADGPWGWSCLCLYNHRTRGKIPINNGRYAADDLDRFDVVCSHLPGIHTTSGSTGNVLGITIHDCASREHLHVGVIAHRSTVKDKSCACHIRRSRAYISDGQLVGGCERWVRSDTAWK